ncbi:MAG: hypothetical protein U0167_15120 [bacterium]
MKTTMHRNRISKLLTLGAALATSLSLGACFQDTSLGPSSDNRGTNPPPTQPSTYDVTVALSHLTVLGTCDGPNDPGEFQYQIEIWARDHDDHYVLRKRMYGYFTGYVGQTQRIDHAVTFSVEPGKSYYVDFKAVETDGAGDPDDYVGEAQAVNTAGGELHHDRSLKIGGSGCSLSLSYTADERPIE